MHGIFFGIKLILGGLDLILRSLLLYSPQLENFHSRIVSWFTLQIHSLMARLMEISFGNPSWRRRKTPSLRTKLGIQFPFLLERNFSGENGYKRPRVKWMDRLADRNPG
jgi:hypothetical protein